MNKEQILKDIEASIEWREEWLSKLGELRYEVDDNMYVVALCEDHAFAVKCEIATLKKYQYILENNIEVNKDNFIYVAELINQPKFKNPKECDFVELKVRDNRPKPWWKFW